MERYDITNTGDLAQSGQQLLPQKSMPAPHPPTIRAATTPPEINARSPPPPKKKRNITEIYIIKLFLGAAPVPQQKRATV